MLRSARLGAATGLRSMAAPSRLSRHLAASPSGAPRDGVSEFLGRKWVSRLLQIAAMGEMIGDKLPTAPDRIEPGPLLARALFGGLAGGVFARVHGERTGPGILAGSAAAVAAAYAGYHLRRALVHDLGLPDLPVALCEDTVALTLAHGAIGR